MPSINNQERASEREGARRWWYLLSRRTTTTNDRRRVASAVKEHLLVVVETQLQRRAVDHEHRVVLNLRKLVQVMARLLGRRHHHLVDRLVARHQLGASSNARCSLDLVSRKHPYFDSSMAQFLERRSHVDLFVGVSLWREMSRDDTRAYTNDGPRRTCNLSSTPVRPSNSRFSSMLISTSCTR